VSASWHVSKSQINIQFVSTSYEPSICAITVQFRSDSEKFLILQKIKLNTNVCVDLSMIHNFYFAFFCLEFI